MNSAVLVTTVATEIDAERLAGELLGSRAAACIQTLPIASHYRWEGEVHKDPEILLLIKTPSARAAAARAVVEAVHPYDVPEVVVLDGEASEPYLAWMTGETLPGD